MCRGSTDKWGALHTATCAALLLPFTAISTLPMKNEVSLSIQDVLILKMRFENIGQRYFTQCH